MDWEYLIRGYYNNTVKPPKKPGDLALEVGVNGDSALSTEATIFSKRPDIGRIVINRRTK